MPILSELKEAEKNNWSNDFEVIATCWDEVCTNLNGKSEGSFNHYFLKFKLEIPTHNRNRLYINGERMLHHMSSPLIPRNGKFSQLLEFKIKHPSHNKEFSIHKKSVFAGLKNRLKGYTTKSLNSKYVVNYQTDSCFNKLSKLDFSKLKGLRSIKLKNNALFMRLNHTTHNTTEALYQIEFFLSIINSSIIK